MSPAGAAARGPRPAADRPRGARLLPCLVLAGSALAAPFARAQGDVRGRVLDVEGRPVAAASVTLSGPGGSFAATTDSAGAFSVAPLRAGRYRARAEHALGLDTRDVVVPPSGSVEVVLALRPRYTDTVVVTASRSAQTLATAPATVTVIPATEIQARAAQSFADLFAGTAGLNATRLNARDMSFDFRTASGILARSQLVLLDGRSLNQEGLGIVLWDYFPVGLDDVEQIELIGTPGSAVWGANALTGVINVRTRAPRDDPGGAASVGLGTVGARQGRLRWAQAPGRLSYRAAASYLEEGEWEREERLPDGSPLPATARFENRGTKQAKLELRADWEAGPGRLFTAHAGWVDSSGIVHTSTGPNRLADSGSYATYAAASYRSDRLDAQLYWNRSRGDTQSVLFGDDFQSTANSVTGEVVARRTLGSRHALTAGATATLTGFDLTLAPGDSFRSAVGAFVEGAIAVTPKLTFGVGSRVDKFDTFGATFSPRTSLVFRPTSGKALRLAFNRAYRAPSLIETFASTGLVNVIPLLPGLPPIVFATQVTGNRDLDPEVMRAVELGFTTSLTSRASLSATAYYNSLKGRVGFVQSESYGPTSPPPGWPLPVELVPPLPRTLTWLNVGNVRDRGLELAARAEVGRGVTARASYSYQTRPTVTDTDPRFPLQLNRPASHKAAAGAVYTGTRLAGALDVVYSGRAFWADILDARFWGETRAYVQVNAKASYSLRQDSLLVSASATNLFDRRIQQHVFGDIVPRQLVVTLRAAWGRPKPAAPAAALVP